MIEVYPDIYQLKMSLGNFPPHYVNDYIIKKNDGCILIDTCWDTQESFDSLIKQLNDISIELNDITDIILTHSHTDHASLAGKIRQLTKAKIYLHKLELDILESEYSNDRVPSVDGFIKETDIFLEKYGIPHGGKDYPDQLYPKMKVLPIPDVVLLGGEHLTFGNFSFDILFTPGHTSGHISLYEPDRKILLSGDLIFPTISSNPGLHLKYSANPLDDYLNSLNTIKELDIKLVLPGHEYPFTSLTERINEIVQRYEDKRDTILETMNNGITVTAYDITLALSETPDSKWSGWRKLSYLDRRFALLETVAHLESLAFNNVLTRYSDDNVISYRKR